MKTVLTLLTMLLAASLALTQTQGPGQGQIELPPRSDNGTFAGTWYYVDPGVGIAIYAARDTTGLLVIRYEVRFKGGTGFATDEGGYAKFIDQAGNLVEVLFSATPMDANRITGHYERTVHAKKTIVREFADFEMYRTEKGSALVQYYPVYTIEVTDLSNGTTTSSETSKHRLYRKASEIVVGFDEIPF